MNHSAVLINPRSQGKKKKEEGNEDVGGECIYGKEDEPDVMGLYLGKKKNLHHHYSVQKSPEGRLTSHQI